MSVNEKMTAIADAIRAKTGGTEALTLDDMAAAIAGIGTGGGDYTSEQIGALIEKTVTAFAIPDGVTTIGAYAFYGCASLQTVTIPDSVTSIGTNAFSGCKSITVTQLPDGITSLNGFNSVSGLMLTEFPANLERIENYALVSTGISVTEIPAGVTYVGTACMQSCEQLTELTFLGTPASIAANAFGGSSKLTVLNVPWAEGDVANAPWGATAATINYGYTGS